MALQKYGLYSNWRAAGYPKEGTQTRGTRLIDGIFSTTRTAAPVRQQILGNYGSDHRAVLVQYTNRSRSSTAALTQGHGRAGRCRPGHDHRPLRHGRDDDAAG